VLAITNAFSLIITSILNWDTFTQTQEQMRHARQSKKPGQGAGLFGIVS